VEPKDLKRVVVVGAGTMGHSIAQVFAQAGLEVGLVDVSEERLTRALHLVASNLKV
jgi:3-hydroxyacyl-CoA dehydrogenase